MAQLATVRAAAKELAVSEMTVRRLIDRGELPVVRIGRAVRIDRTDLRRYIKTNRAEASQ